MSAEAAQRPAFLDAISAAYSARAKNVVVLSGNTHDQFWCSQQRGFRELEQTIYQQWSDKFTVLRLDASTGVGFYDDGDLAKLSETTATADGLNTKGGTAVGDIKAQLVDTRHSPLPALVLLTEILRAAENVRKLDIKDKPKPKPVCVVVQFAGALFPSGDYNQLAEVDRQRLVTFLNLIESPWFKASSHLIILVADTKSEINSRVIALPSVECVEVELPNKAERANCVNTALAARAEGERATFEKDAETFIVDTAGMTLVAIQDMLEASRRTKTMVTRKSVVDEINRLIQADLGDIVKISRPEHSLADVIGNPKVTEILTGIFTDCDDVDTAVSAVIVSGPNGGGKTFRMEAHAAASGRVVIELIGLRGQYFGQTDALFEKLRLRLRTYGRVLILVDEAHTALGSVHKADTHETERRLAGNMIKLMGDPTMFGKVVWGLMTSRPDQLDPDVKSRAPDQVAIFDPVGEERKQEIVQLFARKKITIADTEIEEVLKATAKYSKRDLGFLVKKVKRLKGTVLEALKVFRVSNAIEEQRRMQTLIAAQHCSYPELLSDELKALLDSGEIETEIAKLKLKLRM